MDILRRADPETTVLRNISGEIDIDVGRVNLDAADLAGKIKIRNRFGETKYYLKQHDSESTCRLTSDSGPVRLFLAEDILSEISLTVNTMCGSIEDSAVSSEMDLKQSNNMQLITLSTAGGGTPPGEKQRDVDIHVVTRNGDVTLEKTV